MTSRNDLFSKNIFLNLWGLALLLILILIFQLVGYFISIYFLKFFYQISVSDVKSLMNNPDGSALAINIGRWSNFIQFAFYMGIPALIFTFINGSKIGDFTQFKNKPNGKKITLSIITGITAVPVVNVITTLTQQFPWPSGFRYFAQKLEFTRSSIFENMLDMHSFNELLICIFILALLPALLEEYVFRGLILKIGLNQFSKAKRALFFQAFIFTILHLSLYEFLGIFMMGSILGIISYRNNSLWYNGITHFTFNAVTVILHFALLTNFEQTGVMGNSETFLNNFFVAIPASLIFGFTFYQLTRKENE
jgi:membrane protease YdiL (CAAX protease family)